MLIADSSKLVADSSKLIADSSKLIAQNSTLSHYLHNALHNAPMPWKSTNKRIFSRGFRYLNNQLHCLLRIDQRGAEQHIRAVRNISHISSVWPPGQFIGCVAHFFQGSRFDH